MPTVQVDSIQIIRLANPISDVYYRFRRRPSEHIAVGKSTHPRPFVAFFLQKIPSGKPRSSAHS
ncbi:hypothetical protein ARMGADRAFT_1007686 [Armillaria gallica]|uniref:Uncharacterized protein n=1 Tax=Armillaria gallica TaxID=47427 RepID=A0A2H3E5S6_ARMGA|nr:hypothetical protein ARMGADRAFT_1007686 [Armillaria gallica]